MGLIKNATAGATVEGNVGPINTTLINALGRNVALSYSEGSFDFIDKDIQQAVDQYMLNENGELKFQNLKDFVDSTTERNTRNRAEGISASVQNAKTNFRLLMSAVTSNKDFLTRPFEEVVNCIEYAIFVSVISKVYFPDTKVRVIIIPHENEKNANKIDLLSQKAFDRHAYFVFRDKDGEKYVSIFGQKPRPIDEGISTLRSLYERRPEQLSHIPNLLQKIEAEQKRL